MRMSTTKKSTKRLAGKSHYMVIENIEGKPAELLLTTTSIDKANDTAVKRVAAIARTMAKKGHRFDVCTFPYGPGAYLGHIYIDDASRKGQTFKETFEDQFGYIRSKLVPALHDRKSNTVFINTGSRYNAVSRYSSIIIIETTGR